ncbi:GntR family transcriptional regulator of arabinose operon [Paenibacillus castaneae]|uniref:substrate-binding domain-containing protein n=1 Tax=Paenibacillus castaneae TaxID=474957 RepID=UPI000C9CC8C4|nr:substrate-binding domain-containing protein [Paenibacillus castaneae]NIK80245.1 GntR family transcriptional regulator of arabinose operon [Paenibacillus castaneae]
MSSTVRTPLYQKIQDYIRDLIATEGLKAGDRVPTEKDLMQLFNVSKITVVNAMVGLANDHIITRVPGKGSFVSSGEPEEMEEALPAAPTIHVERAAVLGRTRIIGLVMPSIYDYFAIRLIEGVQRALYEKGYRSMILLSGGDVDREKEAFKTLKEAGAEGLLVFPVDEENYNEEIISMKFSGYPFVLIDRYLPGVETNYIAADGRLGTSLAVDYLWELGHREIAICSDSPLQTITVQERIEGYMDALKNKGALINPAHMITEFQVGSPKDSEKHPLYRYIRSRMATAYITLNGRLGVQIYQMAKKAGLQVPDDLSIISFDDPTSIVEEFSVFTHIKQFEHEMGYRAAQTLLGIIENGTNDSHKYTKTLIKPELVIGQTTGSNPTI